MNRAVSSQRDRSDQLYSLAPNLDLVLDLDLVKMKGFWDQDQVQDQEL